MNRMKHLRCLVGLPDVRPVEYEISSPRETAEIRRRLIRGIRERLMDVTVTFFLGDAQGLGGVGDGEQGDGWSMASARRLSNGGHGVAKVV